MSRKFEGKSNGKDFSSERSRSSEILCTVKNRLAFSFTSTIKNGFQYGTERSYAIYNTLVAEIPLYLLQAFFTFHQDLRTYR